MASSDFDVRDVEVEGCGSSGTSCHASSSSLRLGGVGWKAAALADRLEREEDPGLNTEACAESRAFVVAAAEGSLT